MQFLSDFGDYTPWGGATTTAERIKDAGKWGDLEAHLEDCFYGKTPTATDINDYLWMEAEDVYKALGMKPDRPDFKTPREFAEEWCDDSGYHCDGATLADGYLVITYRDSDDDGNPVGDKMTEKLDEGDVASYMIEDHAEFDEENGVIEYW